MTPQEFINAWNDVKYPRTPLTAARLERFNLSKSTVDFLSIAGFPNSADPNLSFANDKDDIVCGINKLSEQYDTYSSKEEFERYDKYVVIGSCRDGDAIAIDTLDNDTIHELDHEDLFVAKFFNSSINTLAAFLILFRDYETDVLQDKDESDYSQIWNFTDQQFEALKLKMSAIDLRAVTEDGFWKDELGIILSLRKEYFRV